MSGLIITLPLLFACQLIGSKTYSNGDVIIVKDTTTPNYTSILPDGYTAFPDIGVAYKFHKHLVSWNTARKLCIAEDANLAIIDSFKKVEYAMTVKDKSEGIHTGIHRLFDGTEWSNIKTGEPLGFIPWKPDAKIEAGTGQCVAMWVDGSGVGPWNCNNVLPTLCEIPILCANVPN